MFSHVGSDSIYFDAKHRFGTGAVSNPASEYRDWFTFRHFPDDYVSWWDVPTLPCVDKNAPSFVGYIIDEPDSVVAHWMKLGAAGFRLDVADELPDGFIARLRKRVKEINPARACHRRGMGGRLDKMRLRGAEKIFHRRRA